MPQCPRQFRIYLQIEIGICIIYNLIYFKLIKTHQPICLIKTVLANQRRLLQSRQTGVIGIDRNISGIINTLHRGALVQGRRKKKNILIRFGRGTYNHLRTLSCRCKPRCMAEFLPLFTTFQYPLLDIQHRSKHTLMIFFGS